jgi:uncharacterized membrane protein YtjA (UPF0391 family)
LRHIDAPNARGRRAAAGAESTQTFKEMTMLKWALIFFAISVLAGVLQFTQFSGVPVRETEISSLLCLGFVISFVAFLVFGLFALGGQESDSKDHPIVDGIKVVFGWR